MATVSATRGLSPKQRKTVAGGAIGTLIEYYDYYLYGLASAAVFPAVFFSSEDPVIAQLSSFATFAVGFFLRPVGGIIWGIIGDRIGRKTVLMSTVIGMGLATTAIGLIPSDQAIGIAAPLLLLFCRLLQGFFVGGEMGGAATMVVEAAPIGNRTKKLQIDAFAAFARARIITAAMIGAACLGDPPDLLGDSVHVDREADSAVADQGDPEFLFPHRSMR